MCVWKVAGVKLEMFIFDPFHSAKDVTLFEVRPAAFVATSSCKRCCAHSDCSHLAVSWGIKLEIFYSCVTPATLPQRYLVSGKNPAACDADVAANGVAGTQHLLRLVGVWRHL
jgi:hypothetical protein